MDFSAVAEVADHVPVEAGFVRAAGFGIGGADGGVECAADLFVEEGVFGVFADRVVGADGDLAEGSGAVVLVEHGDEEFFAFGCGGVDDFAATEGEANIFGFAAAVDRRKAVTDDAFGCGFNGTGENFAVREIFVAVAVDPGAAFDAEGEVGALGRGEADFFFAVEIVDDALLTDADFAPGGGRVVEVQPGRRRRQYLRRLRATSRRLGRRSGRGIECQPNAGCGRRPS